MALPNPQKDAPIHSGGNVREFVVTFHVMRLLRTS